MGTMVIWPFQMLFSFCGVIADCFVDRSSVNFLLLQMGTAIIVITIFAMLAVYARGVIALFGHKR